MALLNRLFPNKRSKSSSRSHFALFGRNDETDESWVPFVFGPEQVRVLLFRECESRRRKILFDSCSVQKIALESQTKTGRKFPSLLRSETKKTDPVFAEVTNGYGYKFTAPTEQINLVAMSDMIFGTVPLNFQGASMKVHSLQNPTRLMCTKVFPSPSTINHQHPHQKNSDDSVGCASANSMGESIVMNRSLDGAFLDKKASEGDSGFCGPSSLKSTSLGSNYNLWSHGDQQPDSRESSFNSVGSWLPSHSSGSLSSLQRRFMKHVATSMELPDGIPCISPSKDARRSKLALAVVVRLSKDGSIEQSQQDFLFDHMSVLDSIIRRMRAVVEKAYSNRERFVHLVKEGADELQESIAGLFNAPRLPRPMWLSMTANKANTSLAQTFLNDLCILLATLDTKSANFFVSTLVTAVLTYHLGWVTTVLPGTSPPLNKNLQSSPNKMLDSLAKSHPYNPLWAQLGDLKGALGHPLRVSRTMVTGKQSELLNRLVRVLSYFIRCGSVSRHYEEKTELGLPPSTSSRTLTPKTTEGSSLGMRRSPSCLQAVACASTSAVPDPDEISDKVSRLCRVPVEAIMWHVHNLPSPDQRRVEAVRQNSAPPEPIEAESQQPVKFVVGDDDNMDLPNVKPLADDKKEICEPVVPATKGFRIHSDSSDEEPEGPQILELPVPASQASKSPETHNEFAASLMGYTSGTYNADLVVQACTQDVSEWKEKLKRDLILAAHQPLFEKEVAEAICVLANVDKWEVQIVSSHTYIAERHSNTLGVRQGMSQLVADMLESVHLLWKIDTPPEYCLQHLESKLREICLHSHALAQLLLATDFCEMSQLTSALNLEANDVPLLMAVASTHSPEVTQRYGLSFQ